METIMRYGLFSRVSVLWDFNSYSALKKSNVWGKFIGTPTTTSMKQRHTVDPVVPMGSTNQRILKTPETCQKKITQLG
jgi:hypothetical protein